MGHFENCLENGLSRRTSKKSCEKASRRLRSLIAKARRWGLTTEEVAELSAIKRLIAKNRVISRSATWTTLAMIVLVFGGGIVLAYICAPCITRSRT